MKRKFIMMLAIFGAAAMTFFANTTAASACIFGAYQPKEPKILQNK
ncbi:MAG: cyclic lactone autoinducer peptide [Bacillota bacterium]